MRFFNTSGPIIAERHYHLPPLSRFDLDDEAGDDGPGSEQRVVIECKLVWKGLEATVAEGLAQTAAYMDQWGADDGHLAVFDRSPGKPWSEKVFRREEEYEGRAITVWGM